MENSTSCMDNKHCPIHGGWGDWGDYSGCSLTCGLGKRYRERKCDSPKPQYGGRPCNETNKMDFKYCREQKCVEEIPGSGSADGDGSGSGSSGSGSGSGGWEVSGQKAWSDDEDY
ncbi:A disintegrin and metalloproteinase with thrombospondin motif 19 [Desmophyllum pertusum]|uniref:A disintegrin and metalloproteinase with thrombospondin motif 19 n=1 Tax=Desmophyllum pertusum TaxID=174260 RepID=A0A9W9YGV0_9CNID|nr:A disintegrin and metalloproteinase with thrombospondin motif 19 [Desmophyllum pertusum]